MNILKEMVFSLFPKFENNTTQIPEIWPNSGIWRSSLYSSRKNLTTWTSGLMLMMLNRL